jgi:Lysozyme like domain
MPHSKARHEHRVRWAWILALLVLARPQKRSAAAPSTSTPPGPWNKRPLPTILTQDELAELAASVGFPDAHLASAIAMAESRGHTDATNITARESSIGLWQINTRAHPDVDAVRLLEPQYNAEQALRISNGGTIWSPWGAYTDGSYEQFMKGTA